MGDRVELRHAAPPPEEYLALFETTGWNETYGVDTRELGQAIEASWRCVSAYEGGRLIGMGRLVSDGVLYAVLFDVIVAPDVQRAGVGTRIIDALLGEAAGAGVRDVLLFAARGTAPFYERFGFTPRAEGAPGMILRRGRQRPGGS